MLVTQLYTSIFGIRQQQDILAEVNYIGRCICQTIDLGAPIILTVLGILALNSVVVLSPCVSYVLISSGAAIGLSQFLLILNHNIIPKLSNSKRYHTAALKICSSHLKLFKKN